MLLALAPPVWAAGDHEMLAAQQELKIAKDHLQAAGTDYAGHRRAAMQAIDRALDEVRQAIDYARSGAGGSAPKGKGSAREPAEEPDDD
jgi:hypothetical protein